MQIGHHHCEEYPLLNKDCHSSYESRLDSYPGDLVDRSFGTDYDDNYLSDNLDEEYIEGHVDIEVLTLIFLQRMRQKKTKKSKISYAPFVDKEKSSR